MKEMSIDIETYSSVDLIKQGVHAYACAPDFTILLFAYAFDDEEIDVIDLTKEDLPDTVLAALVDESIIKTAYNANFERTCLRHYLNRELPAEQWRCSQVLAAELGLPRSLKNVAEVLGLAEQKDRRGVNLINYFCKPCKPTKTNGGRTRNLPEHAPDKWDDFIEYNRQDVAVELAIKNKLRCFSLPQSEQELWEIDQRINERGVGVDLQLVEKAIEFNTRFQEKNLAEMTRLTGLANVNSVAQLKGWVRTETGRECESLDKKAVKALMAETENPKVKRILKLRSAVAKSSVKKYEAMRNSACPDGRLRGITQFYGASRTGRWAGRIVQPQNLPQNHLPDLDFARSSLKNDNYDMFELVFDNVPQVLSELIRTALIPKSEHRFIVSDFSAIEARVVAWLADEKWRQAVFAKGGDIYCASAEQMFKVPVKKHGINGHLRQKGKIAELALGYGGSVGALKSMGALEMGLDEGELQPLVDAWRLANRKITKLWYTIEKAAVDAVKGSPSSIAHGITFNRWAGILFAGLPSGRRIAYVKPHLEINKFGREALTYMGISQTNGGWTRLETFGGKLTENIVQAIARDCLAESIKRLEKAGYEIEFHVHDEVIIDAPKGFGSLEEVTEIMGREIPWAKGLLLNADGYECPYYRKD